MKDIVIYDDFISKEDCNSIIQGCSDGSHKKIGSFYDERIEEFLIDKPQIVTPTARKLYRFLGKYLSGSLSTVEGHIFNCISVIRYPANVPLPLHLDNQHVVNENGEGNTRTIGFICFLNDDFEGGELIFPNQEKTIKPVPGSLVIFPLSHLYPHSVNATSSYRYIMRANFFKNPNKA